MDLTPLDIRNQEFRSKTLGGLDKEEVKAFLAQVATEFEAIRRENTDLTERLKSVKEQNNHYKLIETSLQEAALTMQKAIDHQKEEAHREAEVILAEARANAEKESLAIRSEADDLRREVQDLRTQRNHFFIRMRSLLQSQQDMLVTLEQEDDLENELQTETFDMPFRNKRVARQKVDTVLSQFPDDKKN